MDGQRNQIAKEINHAMGMKILPNYIQYWKLDEAKPGDTIEGFFKEWRPSDKKGYQPTIIIEDEDGETIHGVAATRLTKVFVGDKEKSIGPQILPGWFVSLKYLGSKVIETGDYKGSNAHQFEIGYDDQRIHPIYGGDPSARKPVEYKPADSEPQQAAKQAPPPLAKPEPAKTEQPATQQPAPQEDAPAQPAAGTAAGKTRKFF